jgi:hypothetical protein
LTGLLSGEDSGRWYDQRDCKNTTGDCANVHVDLLASLILTGSLDCGASIVGHAEANTGPIWKDATPGALYEIFLVRSAGAVNACWELRLPQSTAI